MKKVISILLIFFLPILAGSQVNKTDQMRSIAFIHVTVIDVTGAPSKSDMTVVLTGNRILAVGKTGKVRFPRDAEVIDATGKFLIPGLWDMHAHSISEKGTREIFFPLEIANGITGLRDMFADCFGDCPQNNDSLDSSIRLEQVNEWRRQTAVGAILAPRIIASSPLVDGPRARWPGSLIVKDASEGREAVRYIKKRGNDFIKVYTSLPRDAYFAIAAESKKQHLVFAGHVPYTVSAIEASDAGQKSVEHLTGVLLASSSDEANLRRETLASRAGKSKMSSREIDTRVLETYNDKKAATLFSRFVRNGTWMCPTLTVLRGGAFIDDEKFTSDVRLKYLPPILLEDWKPVNDDRLKDLTSADFLLRKKRFQKYLEIVGSMNRAGVKMLAGTDEPNPYCFPGFSLHDELDLLVQAGLTPLEALQTATINPAKYLLLQSSLGTIEKGKLADMVLLDADPLLNIGNTRKIAAVVANGKYLSREVLEKMVGDVEAASKKL